METTIVQITNNPRETDILSTKIATDFEITAPIIPVIQNLKSDVYEEVLKALDDEKLSINWTLLRCDVSTPSPQRFACKKCHSLIENRNGSSKEEHNKECKRCVSLGKCKNGYFQNSHCKLDHLSDFEFENLFKQYNKETQRLRNIGQRSDTRQRKRTKTEDNTPREYIVSNKRPKSVGSYKTKVMDIISISSLFLAGVFITATLDPKSLIKRIFY